jgi:hypothetical protein
LKSTELRTRHQEVFRSVLSIVERHGLLKGEIPGADSISIEANAAMHSIVRKDTKKNCRE